MASERELRQIQRLADRILRVDVETEGSQPSMLGFHLIVLARSWASLGETLEGGAAGALRGCSKALMQTLEDEQRRVDFQWQAHELGETMEHSELMPRHPVEEHDPSLEIEHHESSHGALITNDARGTLYFHLWISRLDDDGDLAEWLTKWWRELSMKLVEGMTIVFAEPFSFDTVSAVSIRSYGVRQGEPEAGEILIRWPLVDQGDHFVAGDEHGWVHFSGAVLMDLIRVPGESTHAVFEIESWRSNEDGDDV